MQDILTCTEMKVSPATLPPCSCLHAAVLGPQPGRLVNFASSGLICPIFSPYQIRVHYFLLCPLWTFILHFVIHTYVPAHTHTHTHTCTHTRTRIHTHTYTHTLIKGVQKSFQLCIHSPDCKDAIVFQRCDSTQEQQSHFKHFRI